MIKFKKGTPDAIDCKVYPMSQKEDEALKDFLAEQLEKGYIRPSKSHYASSFFFISKKDGKLHPVEHSVPTRRSSDLLLRPSS